jgi:ribulose-5-phosphate 4-epimerase/fuculose-1-phosphate aldolase
VITAPSKSSDWLASFWQVSVQRIRAKGSSMTVLIACSFVTVIAFTVASAQMDSPGTPDRDVITDLVYANRILADQNVVDGFGHVSVREPGHSDRFLLSRSMAPALVSASDILEYDSQGEPTKTGGPKDYLERFIHAAIYRARPDVIAVVHSHSAAIIPFGVTGTSLRPVYHMSAFLGGGVPIFDIRKAAGETDMLISNNKLGDALAKALGDKSVVLMRGHGSVAVGNSIQQAVFRAIYTEINGRIQMDAMRLGSVTFLSPEESEKAAKAADGQITRSWDLWKRRITIDAIPSH